MMKKIQFTILSLIAIGLLSCKTQQSVIIKADISNGLEPGSCYFSIRQNEGVNKESSFVIEVVPPKYEKIEEDYSEAELDKYSIGNGEYQIQIRESHFKFILKDTDFSKFTNVKNPIGYLYCMVEVPAEFITLTKESFKAEVLKLTKTRIIQQSIIIKRYVNKKPKNLHKNQCFFEGGYWSKPKRAIANSF